MKVISIKEDEKCLNAQRETGCRGEKGSVDTPMVKIEERKMIRVLEEKNCKGARNGQRSISRSNF